MSDPNYHDQTLVTATQLTVEVDTPNVDYAVHYRLNFDNHCQFDPIIINH